MVSYLESSTVIPVRGLRNPVSNKKKKERKRDRDRKKERERKEGGKQSIESVMIGLWNGKKLCWFFFSWYAL